MQEGLAERFRLFDTSIVSDALDAFDVRGVITGHPPARPQHRASGPVTTVRLERVEAVDGPTNFPYAMLEAMTAGRVLVIEGVADDLSCWGGRASDLAEAAGVEGVIVDGGYRDADVIAAGDFPVFARAPTPRTGQRRVRVAAVDEAITIDDVTIAPDDLVVADATGVVVVPADVAGEVADEAEAILGEELLLEAKIANGASVADLRDDDHEF